MNTQVIKSNVALSGHRSFEIVRSNGGGPDPKPMSRQTLLNKLVRHALPNTGNREVNAYRLRNARNVLRGLGRIAIARAVKAPTFYGMVSGVVTRKRGEVLDLGIMSCRVVTDAGVGFIVDAWQNSLELEIMKYHGFGTGGTSESASQTALVTELTTQYATDNTRPTGSLTETSANIFRTVGTLSPDASVAITEHGIFSQASNAGGVMFDRSLFSAVNLVSGDSLQITYDLTLTSGS